MAAKRQGPAAEAHALLGRERAGVLATLSARHGGAPFASLASYALTREGQPFFLFSDLSQHTQNLEADPRATLYVQDSSYRGDDPQQIARVALVGRVSRAPEALAAALRDAFLSRHPQAGRLLALDFSFFVLAPEEAHWVGGFASATWLEAKDVIGPLPG